MFGNVFLGPREKLAYEEPAMDEPIPVDRMNWMACCSHPGMPFPNNHADLISLLQKTASNLFSKVKWPHELVPVRIIPTASKFHRVSSSFDLFHFLQNKSPVRSST